MHIYAFLLNFVKYADRNTVQITFIALNAMLYILCHVHIYCTMRFSRTLIIFDSSIQRCWTLCPRLLHASPTMLLHKHRVLEHNDAKIWNLKPHSLSVSLPLFTCTICTQPLHHEGLDIVHTLPIVPQLAITTHYRSPLREICTWFTTRGQGARIFVTKSRMGDI